MVFRSSSHYLLLIHNSWWNLLSKYLLLISDVRTSSIYCPKIYFSRLPHAHLSEELFFLKLFWKWLSSYTLTGLEAQSSQTKFFVHKIAFNCQNYVSWWCNLSVVIFFYFIKICSACWSSCSLVMILSARTNYVIDNCKLNLT